MCQRLSAVSRKWIELGDKQKGLLLPAVDDGVITGHYTMTPARAANAQWHVIETTVCSTNIKPSPWEFPKEKGNVQRASVSFRGVAEKILDT